MSTYKVTLHWEFVVESNSEENAKLVVGELTNNLFLQVVNLPEFAYESMDAVTIDSRGAGVDARL